MKVHSFGHAASFTEIKPGSCFVFELKERSYVGIRLLPEVGTRSGPACAALWPGHPDFGTRPGLLDPGALGHGAVLVLPDAVLVTSLDAADARPGGGTDYEAGQLFISGRGTILVVSGLVAAGSGQSLHFLDMVTGALIADPPPDARVRYAAWRIVHKWLNNDYETICSFRMRSSGEIGFTHR